jgi:peptidylprolyl isomerase
MADEKKPDGGSDRQKLMTVLVPAGGAAVVIILVAVILTLSDSPSHPSDKNKAKGGGGGGGSSSLTDGAGKPMSDGSNGGTEDPGLKDIGGGLKIRDLREGTGPEVKPGATATFHYTGWLVNGQQFDSSKTRGPFTTSLDPNAPRGVIRGWQKGIPGMKVGGIRKLVIPSDLAYGPGGQGEIPPNATLVFEVEVLEIK